MASVVRLLARPAVDAADAYGAAAASYEDAHWLWLRVGGAGPERGLLRDVLSAVAVGARVLDAGCGSGRVAQVVHRFEPTTRPVLLDTSAAMLSRVDPDLGARVRSSVLRLPFANDSFDLVIAAWSLETTGNAQLGLDECLRVLRPGGMLAAVFCAMPSNRFVRAMTLGPRWVVERSFAGRFLAPALCPTAPHEVVHRRRGGLQLAVQVSFRKPPAISPDVGRFTDATSCNEAKK